MGKNLKGKELGKGLSQRKDGTYSARFVTTGGKRIEKYFDTLPEAKRWLEDARYKDQTGHMAAPSGMTLDAWYEQWIDAKGASIRPNTLRTYRERYVHNISPVIGRMKLADIKPVHCQQVLDKMVKEGYVDHRGAGGQRKAYKGATVKQTLDAMRNIFFTAEELELIEASPVKRSVKNPLPVIKKARCLTLDEQRRFLEAAEGTGKCCQYRLVLETGLRTGELVGLRWQDVDFNECAIHVERQLGYRQSTGGWTDGAPKSEAGRRTIPMTDACCRLLYELYGQREQHTAADDRFEDLVFLGRDGMPTKNSTYDVDLYRLCDKAGIQRFGMHVLRHTFATRCLESGMNMKDLQIILGHSSYGVTADTYVHVTADAKIKAMRRFEDYTQREMNIVENQRNFRKMA